MSNIDEGQMKKRRRRNRPRGLTRLPDCFKRFDYFGARFVDPLVQQAGVSCHKYFGYNSNTVHPLPNTSVGSLAQFRETFEPFPQRRAWQIKDPVSPLYCWYREIIHNDAPCRVVPLVWCDGVGLVSRKPLRRNQKLVLTGNAFPLSQSLIALLKGKDKDFSLVNVDGQLNVLYGPASYLEHCCQPNCAWQLLGAGRVELRAVCAIDVDERLSIAYSPDYDGCCNPQCCGEEFQVPTSQTK